MNMNLSRLRELAGIFTSTVRQYWHLIVGLVLVFIVVGWIVGFGLLNTVVVSVLSLILAFMAHLKANDTMKINSIRMAYDMLDRTLEKNPTRTMWISVYRIIQQVDELGKLMQTKWGKDSAESLRKIAVVSFRNDIFGRTLSEYVFGHKSGTQQTHAPKECLDALSSTEPRTNTIPVIDVRYLYLIWHHLAYPQELEKSHLYLKYVKNEVKYVKKEVKYVKKEVKYVKKEVFVPPDEIFNDKVFLNAMFSRRGPSKPAQLGIQTHVSNDNRLSDGDHDRDGICALVSFELNKYKQQSKHLTP